MNAKFSKTNKWFEPIGLLLLLFSFGWQCFEEHSIQSVHDAYMYELNEKLISIWSAVYSEALETEKYNGGPLVRVNHDVLNNSVKDWNQIKDDLNTIYHQQSTAFIIRLFLYIVGSGLIIITKLPHKRN